VCDGNGGCEKYAAGTTCAAAASCANGTATPAQTCNGMGTCKAVSPVSCAPYANCNGTVCASSCTQDSDCAAGPCIGPPAVQ
jgi:hypothetical protein